MLSVCMIVKDEAANLPHILANSTTTGEKDRFLQVVKVEQMARWMLFKSVEDMMECYSTAKR